MKETSSTHIERAKPSDKNPFNVPTVLIRRREWQPKWSERRPRNGAPIKQALWEWEKGYP